MSLLNRAQVPSEDLDALRTQIKTALLDWVWDHVEPARGRVDLIRESQRLDSKKGSVPYELFVAPVGTSFRNLLGQAAHDVANEAGVRIDLERWGTPKGNKSIIKTDLGERFGEDLAPAVSVLLLEQSDAGFEQVNTFAKQRPETFVVRRHRAMSSEVATEMMEIEKHRIRPVEKEMKVGPLHEQVRAGLRVIGAEMGFHEAEHPFITLSRQDPLLGALYLSSRAQALAENPPIMQPWTLRNASNPGKDRLSAVAYHNESRFLSDTLTRRALRGQQDVAALLGNQSPQEAMEACLENANQLGMFAFTLSKLGKVDTIRSTPEAGRPADAEQVLSLLTHHQRAHLQANTPHKANP
jgi:hypothetical protein